MKKTRRIGKKTLSVFLAVLMVLTAWVFVAPMEAEAATAGKYKIAFCIYDNDNGTNGLTSLTVKYKTKANNGTGTESAEKSVTTDTTTALQYLGEGGRYYIVHADNQDFPSYIYAASEVANFEYPEFRIKVLVAKAGTADYYQGSTSTAWREVTDFEFHHKDLFGSNTGSASTTDIKNTPVAASVAYVSGATSITLPKTGAANKTNTYVFGVYDQYGVRMSYDPTAYYVRSTEPNSVQSSSSVITGVTMASSTGVLTTTASAQMIAADSKTVYIHARYGDFYANKAVTLNDPTYTYRFNKNTTDSSATIAPSTSITGKYYNTFGTATTISGSRTGFTFKGFYQDAFEDSFETENFSGTALSANTRFTDDVTWYAAWQANQYTMKFTYRDENGAWVTTNEVAEYYGRDIPFPALTSPVNVGVDYTYTFTGWSPAHTTVQATDDMEYTAQYSEEIHYADYEKLEEQIDLANGKKAEQSYIDGAYTNSTVTAFENALTAAESSVENKLLLSQQSQVDTLTENLKSARENLDIKNFTVLFVDEDGAILKDGYFFVPYGASVTAPTNPGKASDDSNHYNFVGWDSEESDSLDACNYVKDNLSFIASFSAEAHTLTETETDSTCTADGVITHSCDVCGYSYTTAGDTAGHTWSTDYKELIPATCATKGSEAIYCTVCGAIDETTKREIAELEHDFGEYTELVPVTCLGDGANQAVCSRCGGKDIVTVEKTGHSYGDATTVAATCTTGGYTERTCSVCGFVEITNSTEATGHSEITETKAETCVSSGYTKVTCENCDYEKTTIIPATGIHTPGEPETVYEATCTTAGLTREICSVCKTIVSATVINPLGHSYKNEGAVVVTDPTCTTAGYTTYNCDNCDESHTDSFTDASGHDWGEWVVTHEAEGDVMRRTCNNDTSHTEEYSIPSGGHDFDTQNPSSTTEGDCLNEGTKTFRCINHTDCGVEITVTTEYGAHIWGEWEIAPGERNDVITRVCQREDSHTESYEIPVGGHEFDTTAPETTEGTCQIQGTSIFKCTSHDACGETITVNIGFGAHSYETERVNADCTESGYIKTYCDVCGETFSNEILPATGHNYDANRDGKIDRTDAVYTAPAQNTDGTWNDAFYTYTCQNGCGTTYDEVITETFDVRFFDSKGEQIGETQTVRYGQGVTAPDAPSKSADETYHYEFSGWDRKFDTITSDLDVYPTYEKEAHYGGEATCGTQAECEVCGTAYGLTDSSKHIMATETTPATCSSDGEVLHYCISDCGYSYSEKIAQLSHNFGAWETVVAGNCQTPHVQVRKCLNANCDVTEEKSTIKPHSFVIIKGVAPTCTTVGYTDYQRCTGCGLEIEAATIEKLKHEDLNGDGYCDYCGTSQSEVKCNCMCHSTGFLRIIYRIFRFFWMIAGNSKQCGCGDYHY